MSGKREEKYINKSLDRALSVINIFSPDTNRLSVTDIAKRMNTRPGTIYPTLVTLEKHGYLNRDGNKKYSLGLKFLEKGNQILSRLDLLEKAKPYLRKLATQCRANSHLAILYDRKVMYLHREEGYPSVIIKDIIGRRVPAYCTALGKVLLAHLPDSILDDFLKTEELKPLTTNTIVDPQELKRELKRVQKRGYALDDEEFHEGNMGIATPVRDFQGEVIAALSISIPKSRGLKEEVGDLIHQVKDAASSLSKKVGFSEVN